ncbi:SDR family NAD(P)-dependent oxidoreductase [Paraglaciecola sp. 20A4]|uniref:SDR family NAD(P)-dependent oxidoreductase n=1 Tax=Paraglaciecola sp. 20A4 TaxID=2687288 RepID=UPI00140783B0|nr:SDR family NAD(P)-dependent oxidoreductase [Paraglaciecola sp. 20A4]
MQRTILVTGATDGIGFETAKMLLLMGHNVLLHGRNSEKLQHVHATLTKETNNDSCETFTADLSSMSVVKSLASNIVTKHNSLDAIINNAGVYSAPTLNTIDGLDIRFAVNTIAPYILTKALLALMNPAARVVNVSSAAQATVNLDALAGNTTLSDGEAYAQSKLALTMWSRQLGLQLLKNGPSIIAVNPKSLLGSKMVKDAFGMVGGDLRIGADILCRAALSEEFLNRSGQYFDNDIEQFSAPHKDALNEKITQSVVSTLDKIIAR